jgi:hypothetical protein
MQDFWRLTSVLIGLTGFSITGYLLLTKGENLLNTVVKAVLVFAVMLFSVTGAAPRTVVKTEPKPEAKPEAKHEPKPEPAKAAEAKK